MAGVNETAETFACSLTVLACGPALLEMQRPHHSSHCYSASEYVHVIGVVLKLPRQQTFVAFVEGSVVLLFASLSLLPDCAHYGYLIRWDIYQLSHVKVCPYVPPGGGICHHWRKGCIGFITPKPKCTRQRSISIMWNDFHHLSKPRNAHTTTQQHAVATNLHKQKLNGRAVK